MRKTMFSKGLSSVVVSLAVFGILYHPGLARAGQAHSTDQHADEVLVGKIYQKDSHLQKLLFNFHRTVRRSGNETDATRTYTYPNGRIAAIEKATYRKGKLVSYQLMQKQISAHGRVQIRGNVQQGKGQMSFRYVKDGETFTNIEDLTASTVVNDTLMGYMLAHWNKLMQGKEVYARYVVVSHTEAAGFNIVKSGETTWKGKPAVIIKMVPASFFVRLVVDPMYFTVEKDSHRVVKYEGIVTPKVKENGEWTNLDAVMVLQRTPRVQVTAR
jgi:hypothetical protein